MESSFDMTLTGDIGDVARVLDRLEYFCQAAQISSEKGIRLGIVLDELITNIIMHGLKNQPRPEITLSVQRLNSRLVAKLVDNGTAFNSLDANVSLPTGTVEDLRVGGIGLAMVKTFVDKLEYAFESGKNKILIEISIT